MKRKQEIMHSRNFSAGFLISSAVKKTSNKQAGGKSILFQGLMGIFTALLITVKIASPFLHVHNSFESSEKILSATQHCDACEYEATQAVEPTSAISLPVADFLSIGKVVEVESPFISQSHSSSESRGPPQHS